MVHTECYADDYIAQLLTDEETKHHNDKGRVITGIKKAKGEMGLVDDDPGHSQPGYLKKMKQVDRQNDLILRKDDQGNYVIAVYPNLEVWLEKALSKSNQNLLKYFKVKDATALHEIIHKRKPKIKLMVMEMIELENPYFLRLKSWLNKDF